VSMRSHVIGDSLQKAVENLAAELDAFIGLARVPDKRQAASVRRALRQLAVIVDIKTWDGRPVMINRRGTRLFIKGRG
jgi:hypothetical protein